MGKFFCYQCRVSGATPPSPHTHLHTHLFFSSCRLFSNLPPLLGSTERRRKPPTSLLLSSFATSLPTQISHPTICNTNCHRSPELFFYLMSNITNLANFHCHHCTCAFIIFTTIIFFIIITSVSSRSVFLHIGKSDNSSFPFLFVAVQCRSCRLLSSGPCFRAFQNYGTQTL